jgi:hypothetical protein
MPKSQPKNCDTVNAVTASPWNGIKNLFVPGPELGAAYKYWF